MTPILSALRLLSAIPARVYLVAGIVSFIVALAVGIPLERRHAISQASKQAAQQATDSLNARANARVAEYQGAVSVLSKQLHAAQAELARTSAKVDAQLPRTRRALAAVTPAMRDSLPPVVQEALTQADSLLPLVVQLRADVYTVTTIADERHALDVAMIHAQSVVNIATSDSLAQRTRERDARWKKSTVIRGSIMAVLGAFFLGKQQ